MPSISANSSPQKRVLRSHAAALKVLITSPSGPTLPSRCRNSIPFTSLTKNDVVSIRSGDKQAESDCVAPKPERDPIVATALDSTPQKHKVRSRAVLEASTLPPATHSPSKWKSQRRCISASPHTSLTESKVDSVCGGDAQAKGKLKWNPNDGEQLRVVKEALHVSTEPSRIACREDEQNTVLEFCKACVEQEKAGSLYICGCPGTGKSLTMERVKGLLLNWATEAGFVRPDVLSVNCTSFVNTSDIFTKILELNQSPGKKISATPLRQLQNMYSQKSSRNNMVLILADELDYLITKDRAVLHDLFMLTTLPFSRCILIGIANAIDLADRFLPRLASLSCKPIVVTFRAYCKDQILRILQERLSELPYIVFQHQALELCARKVAAACGDMRKALCICRSAIEMLEAEIRESTSKSNTSLEEKASSEQKTTTTSDHMKKHEFDTVRIDHMALSLSKTYRSPVVDTIQSLPLYQQIVLCSSMKHFRGTKKETILGELYKSYMGICKLSQIQPAGFLEFSDMCRVLNDQGLIKLGQSREDKLKKLTLKVDEADITFALQGIRFFQNCIQ
ncbi:PREDICTED: cell division control protein 6 homolog B-like isoform X1 [Lupinus angustifolius]|uniref:cell division control protein 6 homolog B-like isoform X1 n=1 Tax=Lupinus angustifolius TaxID=3871 RepID=UPI00092F3C95|nr:PREDICTED: cell division control protein 6 homolog B-like isoform X1 [Lupinus angustifolius]